MNSPSMNIKDSFFDVNGRFGRLSFSASMLLILCTALILFYLPIVVPVLSFWLTDLIHFMFIFSIIPFFIFSIKRLHDLNLSGWLSLIYCIPVVGFIFFLLLMILKGHSENNQYGLVRKTTNKEKISGWIFIVLFPFIILTLIMTPFLFLNLATTYEPTYYPSVNSAN